MTSEKSSTVENEVENSSVHSSAHIDLGKEEAIDAKHLDDVFDSSDDNEKNVGFTAKKEEDEPYTIFTQKRILFFLIVSSLVGMISPLTGSIYFPSVNQIEKVMLMCYVKKKMAAY